MRSFARSARLSYPDTHAMPDPSTASSPSNRSARATLDDLARLVLEFRAERDWKQFHNPKDQALSLCLESAELLELMQWRNGGELEQHLATPAVRQLLGEELADVLGWILLIAADQKID